MTATTPGLVCAHHHLYSTLARGMPPPPATPTNFQEILEQIWWRLDAALDLEMIRWSAMLGALEALESGTTAIVDHHESPNAIEGSLDRGVRGESGLMTDYPRHIAFIMDGNGRWALRQALARIRGHERGADVLREITRYCCRNNVKEVTFYALSTENYQSRPRMEIRFLMALLRDYLVGERKEILDNNIRLRGIGRIEELPAKVVTELRTSEKMSEQNDGMILRLALNYGSRGEILDAVGKIAKEIRSGTTPPEHFMGMSEAAFARYLYDPTMADPDLLIKSCACRDATSRVSWAAARL